MELNSLMILYVNFDGGLGFDDYVNPFSPIAIANSYLYRFFRKFVINLGQIVFLSDFI